MTITKKRLTPRVSLTFKKPSLTKQDQADSCDINSIMKRIAKGEMNNHVNSAAPLYIDAPESVDYAESLKAVEDAQKAFNSLPSGIRRDFHNEPEEFMSFAQNPDNLDQMVKYGLAEKPKTAHVKDKIAEPLKDVPETT